MNRQNFKQVLDHIKAHPETWNQRGWHCGTVHCFFGWAQIMSGHAESLETIVTDVREWLDLTMCEAMYLYDGTRTLEDFEAALNDEYSDTGADGFDAAGYNRDGYNRHGFGRDGYDRDGYDAFHLDRNNKRKPVTS